MGLKLSFMLLAKLLSLFWVCSQGSYQVTLVPLCVRAYPSTIWHRAQVDVWWDSKCQHVKSHYNIQSLSAQAATDILFKIVIYTTLHNLCIINKHPLTAFSYNCHYKNILLNFSTNKKSGKTKPVVSCVLITLSCILYCILTIHWEWHYLLSHNLIKYMNRHHEAGK